jgi:hypothetical protein
MTPKILTHASRAGILYLRELQIEKTHTANLKLTVVLDPTKPKLKTT